jgi:hypothetical protein
LCIRIQVLGARVFKSLRLSTSLKGQYHHAEICEAAAVQERLQLSQGGLVGLALLSGSDMIVGGADGVGPAGAVKALRLLEERLAGEGKGPGKGSDLLELLEGTLRKPLDEALLRSQTGCSTCKTCRHGAVKKTQHGSKGCAECGTDEDGKGGCLPAPPGLPCPCRACAMRGPQILERLAKAAQSTPRYLEAFSEGRRGYEEGRALVASMPREEGHGFKWRRPQLQGLREVLGKAFGSNRNVVGMVLPLILEYDARYAGPCIGPATADIGEGERRAAADFGILFVPSAVQKVAGSAGEGWRYLMQFVPTCEEAEKLLEEAGAGGAGKAGPPGAEEEGDDEDGDDEDVVVVVDDGAGGSSEKGARRTGLVGALPPEKRAVRMSLIDEHYPLLVQAWKAGRKAAPTPSAPRKKAAPAKAKAKKPSSSSSSSGGGGVTLDRFFTATKGKAVPVPPIHIDATAAASPARPAPPTPKVSTPTGQRSRVRSEGPPPGAPKKPKRSRHLVAGMVLDSLDDEEGTVPTARTLDSYFARARSPSPAKRGGAGNAGSGGREVVDLSRASFSPVARTPNPLPPPRPVIVINDSPEVVNLLDD